MSKLTIEGFITFKPKQYEWETEFHFQTIEMKDYGYVTVIPHTLVVDIPDDFDPRSLQVELLNEKKRSIMAEFQDRITEIDAQIGKLTCLEAA